MRDTEAICEAVTRPTLRFVPIKTVEQEDIQELHRSRSLLMKNRTALINQMRSLLGEYGLVILKSAAKVRPVLIRLLDEQDTRLTPFAKETFSDLYDQLVDLKQRIEKMDKRLERLFKKHPVCQKIAAVPGVGGTHGHGDSSCGWFSPCFSKWPTYGRMAGSCSKTTFKRRKRKIRETVKMGKSLPSNPPDPRRKSSCSSC